MNTHAFIFYLQGNGNWVMEAEKILPGPVAELDALKDYGAANTPEDTHRVFLLPTAQEPNKEWTLH